MQAEGGTAGPEPRARAQIQHALRRRQPLLRRRLQRFRLRLITRRAQMPDLPRPPLREVHDLHRRRARRRPHRPQIRPPGHLRTLISAHTQAPRTTKPQVSEPQASWAANPVTSQGQQPSGLPSHRAPSGMTGSFLDLPTCGRCPGLPLSQSAVMPGLPAGARIGFHRTCQQPGSRTSGT